jgi:hypothetical protein
MGGPVEMTGPLPCDNAPSMLISNALQNAQKLNVPRLIDINLFLSTFARFYRIFSPFIEQNSVTVAAVKHF